MREVELLEAPARSEPNARDKEQYRFAARGRFVESALPPFSCRYAAIRIDIKKNIFPAFTLQPIAKCNGLGIVLARMAQKNARHDHRPPKELPPQGKRKDADGNCHDAARPASER